MARRAHEHAFGFQIAFASQQPDGLKAEQFVGVFPERERIDVPRQPMAVPAQLQLRLQIPLFAAH